MKRPILLFAHIYLCIAAPQVLVFSRTLGYRHDSIPTAIKVIQSISDSSKAFEPTFSEDATLFTPSTLARFSGIAFLSNSEQILDTNQSEALREYLANGGALLAFHSGTACLFNDPEFGVAVGTWFDYHPDIQNVSFTHIGSHPTTEMLPNPYYSYEEVYNFRSDPRSVNATVILSVDDSSVKDTNTSSHYYQGSPHPIAWYRDTPVDLGNGTRPNRGTMTGRLWYTSLGHTNETWESEVHQQHILAGIKWVLETQNSQNSTPSSTGDTPRSSTNRNDNSESVHVHSFDLLLLLLLGVAVFLLT